MFLITTGFTTSKSHFWVFEQRLRECFKVFDKETVWVALANHEKNFLDFEIISLTRVNAISTLA
jgi:hypothetical protein